MRILYINNEGGGYADYINVSEDTTIAKFFKDKMPTINLKFCRKVFIWASAF